MTNLNFSRGEFTISKKMSRYSRLSLVSHADITIFTDSIKEIVQQKVKYQLICTVLLHVWVQGIL
jgi:hypothetical protein